MAVTCKFCGGPHPWFECHKKPDGWKPNVQSQPRNEERRQASNLEAAGKPQSQGDSARQAEASHPVKKRGRPRTGFDKKQYDRDRMKRARAALRASIPS